jgi:hypothetical protein
MRTLALAAVFVVLFEGAAESRISQAPRAGDTYSCSLTFTLTSFSDEGAKKEDKGHIRQLIKILKNELELTVLYEGDSHAAVVETHTITSRDASSLFCVNTNEKGTRKVIALHALSDGAAVYADAQFGTVGGVTIITQNGTCQKVGK